MIFLQQKIGLKLYYFSSLHDSVDKLLHLFSTFFQTLDNCSEQDTSETPAF